MKSRGGKSTCKYYKTCGSSENCARCMGYEKQKNLAVRKVVKK